MVSSVLAIIFIILLFFVSSLQRVFYHQSARELKRRARRGEGAAAQLYRLAAYGEELRLFLWLSVSISAALAFVFLGEVLSFWPALVLILLLVWTCFIWLPNSRVSRLELLVLGWTAAPLAELLDVLKGPLESLNRMMRRWQSASFHTGIYERDDLLDLLHTQRQSPDNRIDPNLLDMAERALKFGQARVEDVMLPRRVVRLVDAADDVTPKLVDELHKSGQACFFVYEAKPDNLVGTLELADLIDLKKSGRVSSYTNRKVYYLHEDFTLAQAVDAFNKTHERMFAVVDKFEDFVGVVTLGGMLAELVGGQLADNFDDYHDRRAVAERQAAAEHIAREAAGTEPEDRPELVAEVVE